MGVFLPDLLVTARLGLDTRGERRFEDVSSATDTPESELSSPAVSVFDTCNDFLVLGDFAVLPPLVSVGTFSDLFASSAAS